MSWKGIERNKLDYILTDVLPVELSELFSFVNLYNYILEKKQKVLKTIILKVRENKYEKDKLMFKKGWSTAPLKYRILKNPDSTREMSLIQPFSAINLYLFIECYQNEILNYFKNRHDFSIRYHSKYTSLYYKSKKNKYINYFQKIRNNVGKSIIQQNGIYFNILKYNSLNSFLDSKEWRFNNFIFKYYAKLDYRLCFDSIYTHSFSWIIERNTIDAINANNSHLFFTIDRILQNINGKVSNGIVIGPEFSRMVSEVLFQQIDFEVKIALLKKNLIQSKNYSIYRYVDDIFIFANEKTDIDGIIKIYEQISEKYRLHFNESKKSVDNTPYIPKEWIEKTRLFVDRITKDLFHDYDNDKYNNKPDESEKKFFIIKFGFLKIDRFKDEISTLMKNYCDNRRTIVSFLVSSILKPISRVKSEIVLFDDKSKDKFIVLLDLLLFIYAFFPSFEQTRKVIAIITYFNKEINLKTDMKAKKKLNDLLCSYSFIFENNNLFDLCDWFPFFHEYGLHLNSRTEQIILDKIIKLNDPILLANILVYSKYNDVFFKKVKSIIERIIDKQINQINTKDIMMHREFWFIIIYNNCKFISESLKEKIYDKIKELKNNSQKCSDVNISDKVTEIICDYMLETNDEKKSKYGFFNWDGTKQFGEQITYRTYQRTLFKNYKKGSYLIDSSMD